MDLWPIIFEMATSGLQIHGVKHRQISNTGKGLDAQKSYSKKGIGFLRIFSSKQLELFSP